MKKLKKEQEAIEKRLAEIDSQIKALKAEQKELKTKLRTLTKSIKQEVETFAKEFGIEAETLFSLVDGTEENNNVAVAEAITIEEKEKENG